MAAGTLVGEHRRPWKTCQRALRDNGRGWGSLNNFTQGQIDD